MNKYVNILLKSSLFSGLSAEDTDSVLDCLGAIIKNFKKNECILMAGNTTEYIGLLLTGKAIVIQEDYWGGQSVMSAILPGHTFAESYACTPCSILDVSVYAEAACSVMFLNVQKMLTTCPVTCGKHNQMIRNLLYDLAGKNLKLGEKSKHMSQKTTRDKRSHTFRLKCTDTAATNSTYHFPDSSSPTFCQWTAAVCRPSLAG